MRSTHFDESAHVNPRSERTRWTCLNCGDSVSGAGQYCPACQRLIATRASFQGNCIESLIEVVERAERK